MNARDALGKMKFLNPEVKLYISSDNGHTTSFSFSCESRTVSAKYECNALHQATVMI